MRSVIIIATEVRVIRISQDLQCLNKQAEETDLFKRFVFPARTEPLIFWYWLHQGFKLLISDR